MRRGPLAVAAFCLAAVGAHASPALAHPTNDESSRASECDVLTGSALSGPRGECLRCVSRAHFHYHPSLPRRQRCHRENRSPPGTARRNRRH
jgi:hypothetical protein